MKLNNIPCENDDNRYLYIEKENKCDICYENKTNYFKCKQCVFKSCIKCFNNFYFNEEKSKCPMCRYC